MDNNQSHSTEIIIFNCNSIYNKLNEIKKCLDIYSPDIVCFTETWLNSNKYKPRFYNYNAEWISRVGVGGGLGILIKNDLYCKSIKLIPFTDGVLEVQGITVHYRENLIIDILNLYNPNKNVSYEELEYYIKQLGKRYIIVGDLNAHTPILQDNDSVNNTGKTLEKIITETQTCLINPINMYTYIDKRTGKQSCLDICATSSNIASLVSLETFLDMGSDHMSLKATIQISPVRTIRPGVARWKLNKENVKKFCEHYIECKIHKPNDIETMVADFTNRLIDSAKSTISIAKENSDKRRRTPWWSSECYLAVKERRKARRNFERHPTNENRREYITKTNVAKNIIKQAKEESYKKFVGGLTKDTPMADVWRRLRAFYTTYSMPNYPIEENNKLITNDMEKANVFNKTFNEKDQIQSDTVIDNYIKEKLEANSSLCMEPISIQEMSSYVRFLKDKAPGHDKITNGLLKKMNSKYLLELMEIYNQSIFTGYFPLQWKHGNIVPIYKFPKPKNDINSYRPITLLSCLGKLLERIVQKRLEYYLESRQVLSPSQHGFRPGRSTEDILIRLSNKIDKALINKEICGVVYIDLKGAFDSVWRSGLIFKMAKAGITGGWLRWFKNYLTDRKSNVLLNGTCSYTADSTLGVPQGGVLSPTMFNIMLYDIPDVDGVDKYIYADDITFSVTGRDIKYVENKLQQYCNEFRSWCDRWKFNISVEKTKGQVFTRKRDKNLRIKIFEREIEFIKEQKILGIIFDAPLLTFTPHINHIKADSIGRVNIMKAISSKTYGASREILENFYSAYILSKITYGSLIFSHLQDSAFNKLEVIQNSCLRQILGARKTTPVLSLQAECNLPPLKLKIRYMAARRIIKISFREESDLTKLEIKKYSNVTRSLKTCASFLNDLDFNMVEKVIMKERMIPPWQRVEEYINDEINDIRTEETLKEYISEYFPQYSIIYTDGSKINNPEVSVSSGMYVSHTSQATCWRLHPQHTVVVAELFAVLQALMYIEREQDRTNYIIFSDSLTGLQILNKYSKTYNSLTVQIKELLIKLNRNKKVVLHWIRGHESIVGNNIADLTAKQGHKNNRSVNFPLLLEEHVICLKHQFNMYWDRYWREKTVNLGKGLFLRKIRNSTNEKSPVQNKNKKIVTALNRLRLGHAGVNKHLFRFNLADSPDCEYCGVEEDIEHLLMDCEQYEQERGAMLLNIYKILKSFPEMTLKLLLGSERLPRDTNTKITTAVGEFLGRIGRLNEI